MAPQTKQEFTATKNRKTTVGSVTTTTRPCLDPRLMNFCGVMAHQLRERVYDKTLFEAASRIIKLGDEKTSPWIRLLDALRARSLPVNDKRRKRVLASSLIEHQKKQSNEGQRNLQ
jgi:hypothetical protein